MRVRGLEVCAGKKLGGADQKSQCDGRRVGRIIVDMWLFNLGGGGEERSRRKERKRTRKVERKKRQRWPKESEEKEQKEVEED